MLSHFFFGPFATALSDWLSSWAAAVVLLLVFGESEIFFSFWRAAEAAPGFLESSTSFILCGVGGDLGSPDLEGVEALALSGEEEDCFVGEDGGVLSSWGLRRVVLRLSRGILVVVERLRVTTEKN